MSKIKNYDDDEVIIIPKKKISKKKEEKEVKEEKDEVKEEKEKEEVKEEEKEEVIIKLKKKKLQLIIINDRVYPTIPENYDIFDIATKCIPEGWEDEFNSKKAELKVVSNLILKSSDDEEIAPSNKNIFRAFYLTRKQDVRVIIVGQDPYPTPGDANGLAFSVNDGQRIPPSLRNIFKEICNCYPEECDTPFIMPDSGNLEKWASREGVFLINSCLTVPLGNAGGHTKPANIWLPFISHILESVTKANKNIFVLLWGKNAQAMLPYIKSKKDRILQAAHPSPLSATKGFFGCNHLF